jgi:hypothetical protein
MFKNCKPLQIATGKFKEAADFNGSGIHSIQNLIITKPNKICADF